MTNKNLARKVVSEENEVLTNVKESEAPVLSIVIDETEEKKEEIPAPEPASKPVATMTIVEKEEVRKPTLEEKIQRVEDLTLLIDRYRAVSYTHLRAHETRHDLVCRLLLEKKKKEKKNKKKKKKEQKQHQQHKKITTN